MLAVIVGQRPEHSGLAIRCRAGWRPAAQYPARPRPPGPPWGLYRVRVLCLWPTVRVKRSQDPVSPEALEPAIKPVGCPPAVGHVPAACPVTAAVPVSPAICPLADPAICLFAGPAIPAICPFAGPAIPAICPLADPAICPLAVGRTSRPLAASPIPTVSPMCPAGSVGLRYCLRSRGFS
jgi:hypothetical protein